MKIINKRNIGIFKLNGKQISKQTKISNFSKKNIKKRKKLLIGFGYYYFSTFKNGIFIFLKKFF